MALSFNSFGGGLLGKANAAADTAYYAVIPGRAGGYARMASLDYTCGNTANPFYGMRPLARANVAVAAGTGQATITVDADPSPAGNTIAAGDQVVYGPCVDGTYRRGQVTTSGWNGTTKVMTFTGNLAANVNTSTKVYNCGVFGDTNPADGLAHPILPTVVNTTATISKPTAGLATYAKGDPILLYNPNATAATNLNNAEYAYTTE